jgi:hypothetical protein
VPTIGPEGVLAETAAEIFADLGSAVQASSGRADLDVSTSGGLGRFLWPVAERISDLQILLAASVFALDPETATGPLLEVVARLQGQRRIQGSPARCPVQIGGLVGLDLSGRLLRTPDGVLWELPPGSVIGVTGSLLVTVSSLDVGVSGGSFAGPWTLVEPDVLVTSIVGVGPLVAGAPRETDPELRARLAATRSMALGTEPAVYSRIAELPGVDRSYLWVQVNREDLPDVSGIPGHSLETLAVGATDEEIAERLLRTASSCAGLYGLTPVTVTLPEDGRPRTVHITRPSELQFQVAVILITTGAPNPLPVNAVQTVRAGIVRWASALRTRQTATVAEAESAIVALLPPGSVSDVEIGLSLDGLTFTTALLPGFRSYGRVYDSPSPARVTGSTAEPFAIAPGWNLDLTINGGLPVSVSFTGLETSAADVAAAISVPGLTASDFGGSLRLETLLTGSTRSIQVRNTSEPLLLTALGLVVGTTNGRDTDIAVSII